MKKFILPLSMLFTSVAFAQNEELPTEAGDPSAQSGAADGGVEDDAGVVADADDDSCANAASSTVALAFGALFLVRRRRN